MQFLCRNIIRLDQRARFGAKAPTEHGVTAVLIIWGTFAMSSVDSPFFDLASFSERKRWETPVVILAAAARETLTSWNTVTPDAQATVTSSGS
jgi:hypothetical protein